MGQDVSCPKYENIGCVQRARAAPEGAGGTHVDYVDRFKGRVTMAFLWGSLKFRANENSVKFYESAYRDGPIRLIRNIQIIIYRNLIYRFSCFYTFCDHKHTTHYLVNIFSPGQSFPYTSITAVLTDTCSY